jgi:hypothetical protein
MTKTKVSPVLSGDKIVALLEADSNFKALPADYAIAFKEFVKNMPVILGKRLSQQVTFASLLKANQHFYKHCLEQGLADQIIAAQKTLQEQAPKLMDDVKGRMDEATGLGDFFDVFFGEDLLGGMTSMVAGLQSSLLSKLKDFVPVVNSPAKFLKESGITEEQGLMWLGLSPELAKRCTKEKVTIGDLLLLEPCVMIFLPGQISTLN